MVHIEIPDQTLASQFLERGGDVDGVGGLPQPPFCPPTALVFIRLSQVFFLDTDAAIVVQILKCIAWLALPLVRAISFHIDSTYYVLHIM